MLEGTILNGTAITKEEKAPEELGVKALDDYTLGYFRKACTIFYVVIGIFSIFPTKRSIRERKGQAYGTSSEMIVSNGPF